VTRLWRVAWFELESDRFDHASELPPDANAGNGFYGRDVATFIAEGLAARRYTSGFLDEDWGWFVRARSRSGTKLEISIYHNIDEDPAATDSWTLNVEERARWGRRREPGEPSRHALEAVFRDEGIEIRPAFR
jgi:hypothetical protein